MDPPVEEVEASEDLPRRSPRRSAAALTEIPLELVPSLPNILDPSESSATSPDELVIVRRGRRRKPVTWSPVEYNKTDLLGPTREKTPEKIPHMREVNSKLRRRLVMSPGQDTPRELGEVIARKLKSLPRYKARETI